MTQDTPETGAAYPARRKAAMAVLLIASFMNLIDVTVVNVALPDLQRTLSATSSQLQWVVAAYTLAFSLALLPFGRMGDTFGRKRMFLLGVGTFTAASLLCGLAPTIEWLIAARVLQGIGGAMMTPQTLAIAQVIFPPDERAGIFALFGFTSGLAAVAGPLLGGVLINLDLFGLAWRPVFLINIPIGLFAIVAGLRLIPFIAGQRGLGIDWAGILIAGLVLFAATFPLIEGRTLGWPLWCILMLAAALPLGWLFLNWQHRQDARGAPQVLPVALLANRGFVVNAFVSTLFFSVIPGFFLAFTIHLQSGFGFTPLQSGVASLPFSIGVLVASGISSRLGVQGQTPRMAGGSAALLAAFVAMALLSRAGVQPTVWTYGLPLLVGGLGLGTAVSPMFQRALASVPPRDAGAASGGLQAIQQAGGGFGVAVTGELFFATLAAQGGAAAEAHAAGFHVSLWYGIVAFSLVTLAALTVKGGMRPAPHQA
ncbi:MAG: MFS transporter [Rhizobiaceae bacterium]|jgi:EmrB/QacA subfamily drug resistance transporter|nr:MFS transporter [Rhizobiaceae bacterium]